MHTNPSLNPRQRKVLTALVDHYIVRAEPISSKLLSQSALLKASSATIRNTMGELETLGLVEQPHSSAGRLPTDQGYRTYVHQLMHPEPLSDGDRTAIDQALHKGMTTEEACESMARALGSQAGLLGLALPATPEQERLQKISLVQVDEGKVLVVLTHADYTYRSSLLETDSETSIYRLEALANRLNQTWQGRELSEMGGFLADSQNRPDTENTDGAHLLLHRSDLKLTQAGTRQEMFLSGIHYLTRKPDFGQPSELEPILEMLESKIALLHFMRQAREREGVHVTVGEESLDGKPFRSISLVTASYRKGPALKRGGSGESPENSGDSLGVVGVMGPKRMPYSRVLPLVAYAARKMESTLSEAA
jgi:heat-inducible transcriptional repressor